MAYDKIIDSAKLDGALSATADAIRAKAGGTAKIAWNETNGFAEAVGNISTIPTLQAKTATPSTSAQTVKPDSGYDGLSQVTVNAMPTATQATPSITVSTAGLITAKSTQTAGYVAAGTKSATKQLTAQAAKTVTPSTADQTAVASGVYTTGAVTVKGDANLVPENIVSGKTIFGVEGSYAPSLQVGKRVTPKATAQAVMPDDAYDALASVVVEGDSNLKAENILSGVSIFGVAGSAQSGSKVATGSFTPTDSDLSTTPVTVSGLGFTPNALMIYASAAYTSTGQMLIYLASTEAHNLAMMTRGANRGTSSMYNNAGRNGYTLTKDSDGFTLTSSGSTYKIDTNVYYYIAIG